MHNFPSFIQYMIPLYLFYGENAFPTHQLNRTFTLLLNKGQYCGSSSGLPASIKFGKKRWLEKNNANWSAAPARFRSPEQTGNRCGSPPRRLLPVGGEPLNAVLSSGETPLTGGRQSLFASNIKRHSAKSAFTFIHYFGTVDLKQPFSPSALPFRGSGRSIRCL